MPGTANLLLRSNGIYYLRLFIPLDLQARFGRRELTRILMTSRKIVAERSLAYLKAAGLRLFAMTRTNPALTEAELKEAARTYFAHAMAEAEDKWLRTRINVDVPVNAVDVQAEVAELALANLRANRFHDADEAIAGSPVFEGIDVQPRTPQHRKLSHYVLRAEAESSRIVLARMLGNYEAGPKDVLFKGAEPSMHSHVPAGVAEKPLPASPTLTVVYAKYDDERKLAPKSKAKFDTAITRFKEVCGDLPVSAITRPMSGTTRTPCSGCPPP